MKETKRRFNVVDIVLIALAALAVVGVLALRDRSTGADASRDTVPMRFTVEFTRAPHGMTDAMRLGDDVYRSTDGAYLGKLADFYAVPHVENMYSEVTGTFVEYGCEESDDVYVTVEGDCYSTAKDIVFGSVPIKVGAELNLKGKGYAKIGYIVGIDTMGASVTENTARGVGGSEAVYELCFEDARVFYLDSIHIGDRFYESVTGALLGTVESIRVEPYGVTYIGTDGEPHWAERPNRSSVIVTLRGRMVEQADGYYLDGGTELKVGASIIAESQYVSRTALFYALESVGAAE